jgi:MFS transporter, DHA1 family, tetracycline resistance protein
VFALFIGTRAPVHLPGAPFLLACLMLACAGVVAWRFARTPAETPAPLDSAGRQLS